MKQFLVKLAFGSAITGIGMLGISMAMSVVREIYNAGYSDGMRTGRAIGRIEEFGRTLEFISEQDEEKKES